MQKKRGGCPCLPSFLAVGAAAPRSSGWCCIPISPFKWCCFLLSCCSWVVLLGIILKLVMLCSPSPFDWCCLVGGAALFFFKRKTSDEIK